MKNYFEKISAGYRLLEILTADAQQQTNRSPIGSKLEKFVELARGCGIKYFEMAHLFSQWGAKCAPKIVSADGRRRSNVLKGTWTR